jgi:hypothetical protein
MTRPIPFSQRFGTGLPTAPLDKNVPESARIGLLNILGKLTRNDYIATWFVIATEALYVGRRLRQEFPNDSQNSDEDICISLIKEISWDKFYIFCEKIYTVLQPSEYEDSSLAEVRQFYADEINVLMAEENLAYEFADGLFHRRGRPQTQKSLQRVSAILADPKYMPVRNHYNKAINFFNERPEPDIQNSIKEAVCALEAFVEILFGKKAAKNFDDVIRSKQGNGAGQIPPTISESIVKLRAFRGNTQGVAHAALEGGYADTVEAELVLSLVATYITYLYDRFPTKEEEIPF